VRHPDDDADTQRMPFQQLRALVVQIIRGDDDVDPESEFDAQPTTYQPKPARRIPPPPPPRKAPRLSTLDELIASLRADRRR
jgi:hypothetical protein